MRQPICGVLLLIGGLTLTPAAAETAASIKTRSIEATVEIEEALKAHPGLFADLLAEGKRWVETARGDADRARREEPDFFTEGRKWHYERRYSQVSMAGRYVSVLRTDETYAGGAHGSQDLNTILWDRTARKRISARPLFRETADDGPTMTTLARLARVAVAAEKIERGIVEGDRQASAEQLAAEDPVISGGIRPRLLGIGPMALAPSTVPDRSSGLMFYYGRYKVGSYVDGEFEVFVHWSRFREYLSPEGIALFAGERPESD